MIVRNTTMPWNRKYRRALRRALRQAAHADVTVSNAPTSGPEEWVIYIWGKR